jgi:hypothetical protein
MKKVSGVVISLASTFQEMTKYEKGKKFILENAKLRGVICR